MAIIIRKEGSFGGGDVYSWTLTNANGMEVTALNFGCHISRILVPGRDGFADVTLSPPTAGELQDNPPYFGVVTGRHANRIENACFRLGDKTYRLAANDRGNHLHGGNIGFHKKLWYCVADEDKNNLTFTLCSPDGDEGYPGNLDVTVCYTLTDANELIITYDAVSDADTVVNLTHHAYFNLAGHNRGSILGHRLQINAESYTECDENCLPTGRISPVEGTPFDFRAPKPVGRDIGVDNEQLRFGNGYDHNFVLDGPLGELRLAAVLTEDGTGRSMKVFTDRPGLQLYTGNGLDSPGKEGSRYGPREALCLETQLFPNGMKHKHFPSPILRAGEHCRTTTIYQF